MTNSLPDAEIVYDERTQSWVVSTWKMVRGKPFQEIWIADVAIQSEDRVISALAGEAMALNTTKKLMELDR